MTAIRSLDIAPNAVNDFCRRHHVRRLGLFGSVLRDDFGEDSDSDIIVEFAPAHVPGLAFWKWKMNSLRC